MTKRSGFPLVAAVGAVAWLLIGLSGCGQKAADPQQDKINQTPQMQQLREQKTGDK